MDCYIEKFEQNREDRAAYGEQLLKKLEQRLNVKELSERRFREFRRLYLVYSQLKEPIAQYILAGNEFRHLAIAESSQGISTYEFLKTFALIFPLYNLFFSENMLIITVEKFH